MNAIARRYCVLGTAAAGLWGPVLQAQTPAAAPTCVQNAAEQATYQRQHGVRLPICAPLLHAPVPRLPGTPPIPAPVATPNVVNNPAPAVPALNSAGAPVGAAGVAQQGSAAGAASGSEPRGGLPVPGAPLTTVSPAAPAAVTSSPPAPSTAADPVAPAGVNGLVAPAGPGPGFNVAPSSNAIPLTPQAASPGVGIVIGPRPAYEPGQLLVYWPDAATLDPVLARIRRDLGLSPAQRTTLARLGGVILLFETSGTAGAPALEAMRARLRAALPNIAVDFNTRYYAESGPHQYFGEHLHLPFSDGPASPVGVVDTEVGAIAALKDLRIVRRSFLSGTDVAAADIHGTAVATLIAGRDGVHDFTGAAAGAPLYVAAIMRRIGDASGTNTLLLAQALDWLLSQQVRIVNLSMGGPGDALMASLMDKAVQHAGLIVIAAAGNGGPAAPPSFPAAYPGVLAVTATNAADQVYSHANHGSYIALAAPGEDLWVPDSGEGRYVSGTSFAAALVSGLASRMLALAPGLSGAAVRQHLCVSARDLGLPGIDPVYGCGLVQAVPALGAVKSGGLMKED